MLRPILTLYRNSFHTICLFRNKLKISETFIKGKNSLMNWFILESTLFNFDRRLNASFSIFNRASLIISSHQILKSTSGSSKQARLFMYPHRVIVSPSDIITLVACDVKGIYSGGGGGIQDSITGLSRVQSHGVSCHVPFFEFYSSCFLPPCRSFLSSKSLPGGCPFR